MSFWVLFILVILIPGIVGLTAMRRPYSPVVETVAAATAAIVPLTLVAAGLYVLGKGMQLRPPSTVARGFRRVAGNAHPSCRVGGLAVVPGV